MEPLKFFSFCALVHPYEVCSNMLVILLLKPVAAVQGVSKGQKHPDPEKKIYIYIYIYIIIKSFLFVYP